MTRPHWLYCCLLALFIPCELFALEFTYDVYEAYITDRVSAGQRVQQIVALPDARCLSSDRPTVSYSIQDERLVGINKTTGDVSVRSADDVLQLLTQNNGSLTVTVSAVCDGLPGEVAAVATLRLRNAAQECVCFPSSLALQLSLADAVTPQSLPYGLLFLDTKRCGDGAYSVDNPDSAGVRVEGERLMLGEGSSTALVRCGQSQEALSVAVSRQQEISFSKPFMMQKGGKRLDFFQYNETIDPGQMASKLGKVYKRVIFSAEVKDAETIQWHTQQVNNQQGQLVISEPSLKMKGASSLNLYELNISWSEDIRIKNSTDIDIVIFDANLLDPAAAHLRTSNNLTVRIHLVYENVDELYSLDLLPAYNLTVRRDAPYATQLLRVSHDLGSALTFRLAAAAPDGLGGGCEGAVSVTPHQGIVYVSNGPALSSCADGRMYRTLTASQAGRNRTALILFSIVREAESADNISATSYAFTCARHRDKDSCEQSVGMGTDGCRWKTVPGSGSNYSTCVSSPSCADRECSELESLDERICPQDCQKKWNGNHQQACGLAAVGICRGEGICFCEAGGDYCQCQHETHLANPDDEDFYPAGAFSGDGKIAVEGAVGKGEKLLDPVCDVMCMVSISTALVFIILLVVVLSLWYHFRMAKNKRKGPAINAWRATGNNLHLTFTPCPEYEQSTPTTILSSLSDWPEIAHSYHNSGSMEQYDQKWELNRENLILEDFIGEGEFGRVMKAKYREPGLDVWTTVAVKMLKDNASRCEYRDLLSEYNLLKEVDHPNVIRLIGAATLNGPFHLVVEFCEHGSLKSHLRKLNTSEPAYINSQPHFYDQNASLLLSFAWQISKGMQYLSDIKLVHRDLATRNILIAADNVIKISDFGMTKDVYEEDAYKKKTQGRIPVKWMAPESLYHHMYTSKSDVWSFGVVLWEIATLGATPYPGIPAERMCQLLRDGYRMERPEICSQALYSLMRQCWNYDPVCRPTFRDLTNSLLKLINDDTEVLDLSRAHTQRMCVGLSEPSSSEEELSEDRPLTESLLTSSSAASTSYNPDVESKFMDNYEVSRASGPHDQKQNGHRYTVLDVEDD